MQVTAPVIICALLLGVTGKPHRGYIGFEGKPHRGYIGFEGITKRKTELPGNY